MSADWIDIHFLNVDHGDCTIIRHPDDHRSSGQGRISFVDINDFKHRKSDGEQIAGLSQYLKYTLRGSSDFISPEEYAHEYLDDPIVYYHEQYGGLRKKVWRFIPTHPDMDHLSGLKRLDDELGSSNETGFSVMWDTRHEKEQDLENWDDRFDKADWLCFENIREDNTDHSVIHPTRGSQADYYQQDNIEILHPTSSFISDLKDHSNPNWNNASFVLKLSYGNQAILLPGDAEEAAWNDIIDNLGVDVLEDVTILKAAHHGVESGFHEEAVRAMDPDHVVLSTGKKKDTDAHHLYREACSDDTEIWSTRQFGTMRFKVTRRRSHAYPSEPDGIFSLPQTAPA